MKKKEMTKLQRKRLERELIRNRRQRKENHKDMKRLEAEFPSYRALLKKRRQIHILEDDEDDVATKHSLRGGNLRGIFA